MKSDSEKLKSKPKAAVTKTSPKLNLKNNKESYEKFQNLRVVKRELVYIIGLSPRLANKTVFSLVFIRN
jgi:hypothetical protein